MTDTLVSSIDTDVDTFLADIDSSVAASRKIMKYLTLISYHYLSVSLYVHKLCFQLFSSLAEASQNARLNDDEWTKIKAKV